MRTASLPCPLCLAGYLSTDDGWVPCRSCAGRGEHDAAAIVRDAALYGLALPAWLVDEHPLALVVELRRMGCVASDAVWMGVPELAELCGEGPSRLERDGEDDDVMTTTTTHQEAA